MPAIPMLRRPTPTGVRLLVLAAATFVFVTTETQPVALLSPMSSSLHVSEGSVGLLMTAYAAVAGLSAIPLTILASRIPRRELVMGTVATLVISQLLLTTAPTYAVALVARLLGALAHGVFWSVIAQVAATLVSRERVGKATATVFAGNSIALVAGTPLVSAIGAILGWRTAVAVMGGLALVTVFAMARVLPQIPSGEAHLDRREILTGAVRRPRLLVVCAVTMFMALGQFVAFTFLAPIVRAHTGLTGTGLSALLLAYGAAGVAGVVIVGRAADRRPRVATTGCFAAIVGALALLSLVGHSIPLVLLAVAAWGAGCTALPICLQSAVLRVAPHVPDTASALYVVAFQIGIGGGALIGAGLLGAGELGLIPVAALALVSAGAVVAAGSGTTFATEPAPSFTAPRIRRRGEHGEHVALVGPRLRAPWSRRTARVRGQEPEDAERSLAGG